MRAAKLYHSAWATTPSATPSPPPDPPPPPPPSPAALPFPPLWPGAEQMPALQIDFLVKRAVDSSSFGASLAKILELSSDPSSSPQPRPPNAGWRSRHLCSLEQRARRPSRR
mmetsp:Transcript_12092/g.38756  ORF Transcript_12092/g.38756 Transcript_12092/m.38756 type:complete len:112 (-) Transcript_12092:519-854(-)